LPCADPVWVREAAGDDERNGMVAAQELPQPRKDQHQSHAQGKEDERGRPELSLVVLPADNQHKRRQGRGGRSLV